MADDQTRMTLGEHLDELRRRLIRLSLGVVVGVAIAFVFEDWLLRALLWPLGVATAGSPPRLNYLTLAGPFTTYVRVGVFAGLILSAPYGLLQIWRFVAAGLYPNERRAVGRCLLPSILLFLTGVAFFYLLLAPMVIRWFLTFAEEAFPFPPTWGPDWYYRFFAGSAPASQPATGAFVQPVLTLNEYISFMVMMCLSFGIAFQTPLVVYFLARTGIVQASTMRRYRRYVIVIAAVAAAVITPTGDAVTMLAMMLPMYLLYEIGLLLGGRADRKRERAG